MGKVIVGDCREVMRTMPDASVDSIVTDPPYGLSFMGKGWDHGVPGVEFWVEALRVAKPGSHLLAFGGTRTYHRLACAIEDAGWEVRDCIAWVYGSGFPKSLDVSKAIDKSAGAEREKVPATGGLHKNRNLNDDGWSKVGEVEPTMDSASPITDAAIRWSGWGTALKPAFEPIIVARKPLVGTVAENVLQHGTGALNIDGCRVETESGTRLGGGRWPANLIHDGSDEVVRLFPESTSGANPTRRASGMGYHGAEGQETCDAPRGAESGSAARFFYCAKASRADRDAGLDGMTEKRVAAKGNGLARTCDSCGASVIGGCDCPARTYSNPQRRNHHPTVKPTQLMRYLCRLVTPPGGTVLDPFTGSGSTGRGALLEGFDFIGVELDKDYADIAEARIADALSRSRQNDEPTLFTQ